MNVSIQRVLIPTDFSEASKQAQSYACALARPFNADLHVLHVVTDPKPLPGFTSLSSQPPQDPLPKIIQDAEMRLASQIADAEIGNVRLTCRVRAGDPVRVIIDYANQHDIDLIVMGTHGRLGLSHVLIGSVAEKVVRIAKCPVLTVHPKGFPFAME